MTFRLGLTGSIGMGKSTTAQMFADAGIPVWDADAAVERLYKKGGAAVEVLAEAMPGVVIDGEVSKEAIKKRIAIDPSALAWLERFVHPLVAADRAKFAEQSDAEIIVFDVPLLFETGAEAWMDAVVVVTTSAKEQRRRVLMRPGMDVDQFKLILGKQLPDKEKQARADFIICTDTMDSAQSSVRQIIKDIRGKLINA